MMSSDDEKRHQPRAVLETVVYCEDLSAAREFYEELLGLTLVSADPPRHLFFRVGTSMLLIFNPHETKRSVVHVGGDTIPQHGAIGACHVAFEVDSEQFESIKQRLATMAIRVESEIDWPGGGHSIYCRDPAGNSVEFATRSLWFKEPQ